MDVKATLKKLHERMPNLSTDELITILDCYTEIPSQWPITSYTPTTWPFTNINYGNPTSTATANFEIPQKCD